MILEPDGVAADNKKYLVDMKNLLCYSENEEGNLRIEDVFCPMFDRRNIKSNQKLFSNLLMREGRITQPVFSSFLPDKEATQGIHESKFEMIDIETGTRDSYRFLQDIRDTSKPNLKDLDG